MIASSSKKRKVKKTSFGGSWKVAGKAPAGPIADHLQDVCLYCGKKGHWKRDCRKYKADQEKGKKQQTQGASASGMFVIEINLSTPTNTSWILDTGCGAHICTHVQGLQHSRRLISGEVDLRVGNGSRVAVLAVGTYRLSLPSGLVLELADCYHVPSLTRNIISVSCIALQGFSFVFKNTWCYMYKDEILYCTAEMSNGLYVLTTDTPTINITNKRLKSSDVNQTYLWHCRLGHINETRISTLLKNGYLDRFDFCSYDVCPSCLLGKMPKKPFKGKGERATEVLGLIHTDVCGPMSTHARGGYEYFITFTDDKSRYGYVYLMKHKSEAFERFKEFRQEVEKQTGKSIKILRSDRGGEYLSAEFQDHLKENGILTQWT
ncbi:DDE-type integrase/transposase/recombinase, partial [Escherichia coli]|uniref:DDE-type integrase/transposase/recombinase n=1 Tax=Escherichia coli TaxID=562 RepID=UPI0019D143F0